MLVVGRGSIAQVQYTGDEAAGEVKKLIDAVVAAEDEFEPWEALVLRAADLEGGVTRNSSPSAIELVRNVFDCFLAKFPLFFGYWKKYADLEFSIGGTETAEMVYERGISCISSSVDLWTHYCGFKMETCHDNDLIRELFERGVEFVGLDFQSHPFWDKYIEFEERINGTPNITKIHERLTGIPTYQFDRYYQKFRGYLNSRPLDEVTDAGTLETCKNQVQAESQGYPEKSDLELDRALRAKLDAHYYDIYARTQAEVTKRWTFEGSIKRGYFHVTDVDDAELVNWRKYLDFEEAEGEFKRVAFLYERCLVACALYEEFWLRYARWMFAQGKDEDTRNIYMRASCIFVPIAQPTIRLHWARFEEKLESIHLARDIHVAILEELPDHVDTMISLAGLERRHEGNEAAIQSLENSINQHPGEVGGQLTAEQARILWQCSGKADEARALFHDRHEKYLESQDFWSSFIKFELSQPPVEDSHKRIKEVYDLMRSKARFSSSAMKDLSQYYLDYLLNRGGKKAAEEYMRLDKELNGALPLQTQVEPDSTKDNKTSQPVSANGQPS